MSKVIFCTVRNYTNNVWVDTKMLQYTHANQIWWADNQYPCVIVDTYNDLNQYLDQADWLVVQTAGDTIMERTHLWDKLHSIDDDVGFIGHLVWYHGLPTPHIHPQCFILRTSAVNTLSFDETSNSIKTFIRSEEDMHQGKAPLELFLTNNDSVVNCGFGAKILEQVLLNGYRAINFDYDWRFGGTACPFELSDNFKCILQELDWPGPPSRGFCYPENNTDLFEKALKDFVVYDGLDISQQMYIEIIQKVVDLQNNKVVNILNWDFCNTDSQHDHIICPAGGLFGEITASKTGAKRITFYDINKHTLAFKQSLYTEWDGNNYIEYAKKWASDRNLITEPRWQKAQASVAGQNTDINTVLDNWNYFKSLEVEFVYCNIIADVKTILNYITENSLLHTSTILNYYPVSMITHTTADIDTARKGISDRVEKTNSIWTEVN
ncbi:hypothetical protein UFOVP181_165 [uncultured Caudovirales phage]|uniref:Uncharacterized protein n=1 Tax=uncultured Caudovirales phage TaxID=2100421 RepID=A0A6J5KYS8_9CAUD|nr:hypothetical protein UFOVP57_474 [uncultured Caudovirales phage]CAB5208776.1 hypothetical protein UFOVP181_165 [uncultured Caudovirales phage]